MTEPARITASPFVRELMRLNDAQVIALKRGDGAAAAELADEIALLLRYNATGRLDEYFASRADRSES